MNTHRSRLDLRYLRCHQHVTGQARRLSGEGEGGGVGDAGKRAAVLVVDGRGVHVDVETGARSKIRGRVEGDLSSIGFTHYAVGHRDRLNDRPVSSLVNRDIADLGVDGFTKDQSDVRIDRHAAGVINRGRQDKCRRTRDAGGEVQTRGVGDTGVGVAGKVFEGARVDVDVVAGSGTQVAWVAGTIDGDSAGAGSGDPPTCHGNDQDA